MSKVLVVGSNGQLAFDLIKALEGKYEIIRATHKELEVVDFQSFEKFILKVKPDVMINTAAFHKTSECEVNPKKSFDVNGLGAYNVSKAAFAVGARIFFISTNYVFSGNKKIYFEDDSTGPLNVYGASKLSGEILTRIANPKSYVIRTSGLFGVHQSGKGYNFVTLMLDKAKRGEEIRVVDDEFCSFTYTADLAQAIKKLIDKKTSPFGIYHITNSGSGSWFDLAQATLKTAKTDVKAISIKSSTVSSNLKRPVYSVLGNKKALQLRHWKKALKAFIESYNQENEHVQD